MSDNESGAPRTKWPRSQRFQLSTAGREAGANYREVIVEARRDAGRKSFDAARAEWAARLTLDATDGLYLGELQSWPWIMRETWPGVRSGDVVGFLAERRVGSSSSGPAPLAGQTRRRASGDLST